MKGSTDNFSPSKAINISGRAAAVLHSAETVVALLI
jgi:hypothetical protein